MCNPSTKPPSSPPNRSNPMNSSQQGSARKSPSWTEFVCRVLGLVFFANLSFCYRPEASCWGGIQFVAPPPVSAMGSLRSHLNLRDSFDSHGRSQVIFLEDIHQNQEAQSHLSEALQLLGKEAGPAPVLVALEGAHGEFLYDLYKKFPDPLAAQDVADSFFSSGKISGPAHAGFTGRRASGERGLFFWGMDDPRYYPLNVQAYRRASRLKPTVRSELENRLTVLKNQKNIFNPALRDFD